MISAIVPRAIAFVSTCDASGRTNAAPFSYFTGVSASPPSLLICASRRREGPKDTERNIIETGEFVVNVVVSEIMDAVVMAGGDYPPDVSEIDLAGLKTAPAVKVKPPRLIESPVNLECRLMQAIEVAGAAIIVGEIVWIHVRDDLMTPDGDGGPGVIDAGRFQPIGRLGGDLYTTLGAIFARSPK
jgi:flavin reductase (DIM6/NTAB) family NADH-FMN oxidoreductase RutF